MIAHSFQHGSGSMGDKFLSKSSVRNNSTLVFSDRLSQLLAAPASTPFASAESRSVITCSFSNMLLNSSSGSLGNFSFRGTPLQG